MAERQAGIRTPSQFVRLFPMEYGMIMRWGRQLRGAMMTISTQKGRLAAELRACLTVGFRVLQPSGVRVRHDLSPGMRDMRRMGASCRLPPSRGLRRYKDRSRESWSCDGQAPGIRGAWTSGLARTGLLATPTVCGGGLSQARHGVGQAGVACMRSKFGLESGSDDMRHVPSQPVLDRRGPLTVESAPRASCSMRD
jgi:hypothetical protein